MPSSFTAALAFTLVEEGSTLCDDPDTRQPSKYGITPSLLRSLQRLHTRDAVESITLADATDLYKKYFWDSASLDDIQDQTLATKIFDLRIDMGMAPAIWCLQQAVNSLLSLLSSSSPPTAPSTAPSTAKKLPVSGKCDAATVSAVNALDPQALLEQLRVQASIRYVRDALLRPDKGKHIAGKLARLARG